MPKSSRFFDISSEVLVPSEIPLAISVQNLAILKERADSSPLKRARILAHVSAEAEMHEMLIAQTHDVYVRPHKHIGKPESMHIIEGAVKLVFFSDDGDVVDVHPLGTPDSGRPFYFRNELPRYHTFLIETPYLVFHETTLGPFRREDTVFAPWSPEESEFAAARLFIKRLRMLECLRELPKGV
jgi:cupin fold WbuC family metalloprotein